MSDKNPEKLIEKVSKESKSVPRKTYIIDEKTKTLTRAPILMTRAIVMFPGLTTSLEVGREKSVKSVKYAIDKNDSLLVQVCQKDPNSFDPTITDVYKIGNLCKVEIQKGHDNKDITILVTSVAKVQIKDIFEEKGANVCNFSFYESKTLLTKIHKELILETYESIKPSFSKDKGVNQKEVAKIFKESTVGEISLDFLCSILKVGFVEKQKILNEQDVNKRAAMYFANSIPAALSKKVDEDISKKISSNLAKQQKEFYLRERIKTIKEELGDINSKKDDAETMREKVTNNDYPAHIKERVLSEINKMEASSNSNEASVTKAYLDTLLTLPWWQKTDDVTDINKVEEILNKSHYGLENVKQRIVEYLAIKMRSAKSKGSVICLVGPPGVGKTSLAKSIAESLGKKFAKISLNGMRDESEIKGHRKTYIGAMPGRIIREMKKAGVINPLFLLDEIDKLSSDQRGDPTSTLLDILDVEQNAHFSDNYVEEDYDLSNVLFLATANYEENIPAPLHDRLEIIRLSSYTELEKLSIAQKYLVKKVLDESNITAKELLFTTESLDYIIKRYTREAGVRELERRIREIARKFVVLLAKGKISNEIIGKKEIVHYLKKEIFDNTMKDVSAIPGVVNGMAYTSFGGDLLPIEVSFSPGKGKITITGNLKETMKESAIVAVAFVKANAKKYEVDVDFSTIDIHIHVPAGGIPKDGPSAGVALTTAILSVLKNHPIPTDVSMTGEITLRGKVTIIGGVKEKVISATRGGVTTVYMPKDDERYIEDIPKEVRKIVKINLVQTYDEIFEALFK